MDQDARWQEVLKDPSVLQEDIRSYLTEENDYYAKMMGDTDALRTRLFEEMKNRFPQDDSSVPSPDGAYAYLRRFASGKPQPIFARTPRAGGAEEVLLDPNPLAEGKAFYRIGEAGHSPDHKLFAYAVDDQGSEVWKIYVKDHCDGRGSGAALSRMGMAALRSRPTASGCSGCGARRTGGPAKIFRRPVRGTARRTT